VAAIYEKPRTRGGTLDAKTRTITRSYYVAGETDEDAVLALVLATAPASYGGMSRKSITATSEGYDKWSADVMYQLAPAEGINPDVLGFRGGTQSLHITQSLDTQMRLSADPAVSGIDLAVDAADDHIVTPDGTSVSLDDIGKHIIVTGGTDFEVGMYEILDADTGGNTWELDYPPAPVGTGGGAWYVTTAPDQEGAIGVDNEGNIAGCDILVGKREFFLSVTREVLEPEYLDTMMRLIGKTNDAEFFGFAPGELLYLGAEPTSARVTLQDGSDYTVWPMTHTWAIEPNRTNINVGGIVVPLKRGFEYMWVYYKSAAEGRSLLKRPRWVYLERVYEAGDMSLLEVGTSWA
jgi:hypothetical protein